MSGELNLTLGQYSDAGRKALNQDFHGAYTPTVPELDTKGAVVALADGIGSSDVSQIASETAVKAFLEDYYCTSEALSVKKAARQVLLATNSWLHAQTRRSRYAGDADRGYVCTLSALVIKSNTAHLFHVGDARVYRLSGGSLEQLTDDHRAWVGQGKSYLSRALGVDDHVDIDYQALPVERGDLFVLTTDGVYEHVDRRTMARTIRDHGDDLEGAARAIAEAAHSDGSGDNLTVQIVRIDDLPRGALGEHRQRLNQLPLPPTLEPNTTIDGYTIVREVHANHRSQVYRAVDAESGDTVALKVPATEIRQDPPALERFLTEEWVARRLDSPHVLKARPRQREQTYLYVVMEFIEGQTLTQWMRDNPEPDLETVRTIMEQIARGLRAFHRQEMVHQDMRPDNVMIDGDGTARIIDFGATKVAGITEGLGGDQGEEMLGTQQYSAPEYFVGDSGTPRSDLFSLGVITYQMLTGRLPYGTDVAKIRSPAQAKRLRYQPATRYNRAVPAWMDGAIRQALEPDPGRRYQDVDEFVHDLRHPRPDLVRRSRPPLIERNPEAFWQGVSAILALVVIALVTVIGTGGAGF